MISLCKFKSGIKKSTDEEDGMTPKKETRQWQITSKAIMHHHIHCRVPIFFNPIQFLFVISEHFLISQADCVLIWYLKCQNSGWMFLTH